jgi:hypothetical protein
VGLGGEKPATRQRHRYIELSGIVLVPVSAALAAASGKTTRELTKN